MTDVRPEPSPTPAPRPSRSARLAVAALAAVWGVLCLLQMSRATNGRPSDFDPVWHGARVLLEGRNPYAAVCHGCEVEWISPLYYPATALLAAAPLAALPLELARMLWVGGASALLAWGLTRDGWHRLPLFLSAAYYNAAGGGQWTVLMTAAVLLPILGPVVSMKPTIGAAVFAAQRAQRAQLWALGGGAALLAASLALRPTWPFEWRVALSDAPHYSSPVTHLVVGGPLILLAMLRWRRPEARLLVGLACVPQSTIVYEGVYFLLVPRTLRGVTAMAIASYGALWLQDRISHAAPDTVTLQWWVGHVLVLFFYLPSLVMVLRRPNEGEVPRWLDALVTGVGVRLSRTGRKRRRPSGFA
ncbi:hypothetical protein [Roseisolibacter sp. H3M3-2]|uniref:hypothetical protein n=1 Tax=Roseisolibacter sp. H3M3-2 TaxID=3031323 RepID=UPI0023DC1C46|nr:hypothetical protein [Roseisolibacter sp. H3M3-2]MDF1501888.1 hypothetical protein [Roseisolibacter sp. H3M3-2]